MNLLRHLLRFGGLYIVIALAYVATCYAVYNGSHHWGWPGVIGLHAGVALCLWALHGFIKS